MKVTLSRDGWHKKVQEYSFDYAPESYNLCNYFWRTVWAVLTIPIATVGHMAPDAILPNPSENPVEKGFVFSFISFITLLALAAIVGAMCWVFSSLFNVALAMGILAGFVAIFLTVGTKDLWVPYIWAIKNKVCPIINWQ